MQISNKGDLEMIAKSVLISASSLLAVTLTGNVNAATMFASQFERVVHPTNQNYLETFNGVSTLGDPAVTANLLGASDNQELGWRKPTPASGFVVSFADFLMDGEGADLVIRDYGPGSYSVFANSVDDDDTYVEIGQSVPGVALGFDVTEFDFNGLDNVKFIKIERTSFDAKMGRFFDSFEGLHAIPEPSSIAMLGMAGLLTIKRRKIGRAKH